MQRHNRVKGKGNVNPGLQGTSHKAILSRWRSLTSHQLAQAIFDTVKGNCVRLSASPINSGSVWGVIVKKLQFANTQLDRLWAHSAYDSNAANLKGILHQICNNANILYDDLLPTSESVKRYCICRRAEPDDEDTPLDYPMLQCDNCKSWFHFICLGINNKHFNQNDGFFCPTCEKLPSSTFSPLIFEIEQLEPDTGVDANRTTLQGPPPSNSENLALPHVSPLHREEVNKTSTNPGSPQGKIAPRNTSVTTPNSPISVGNPDAFTPPPRNTLNQNVELGTGRQASSINRNPAAQNSPVTTRQQYTHGIRPTGLRYIQDNRMPSSSAGHVTHRFQSKRLQFSNPNQASSANFNIELHQGRDDEDEENLRPRDPVRASRKTFVYKKPERLLEKDDARTRDSGAGPAKNIQEDEDEFENRSDTGIATSPGNTLRPVESHSRHGTEGPYGDYQPFNITIPKNEYAPLLHLDHRPNAKDKRNIWQYPVQKWTPVFDDAFRRDCSPTILKGCKLRFKDHRIHSNSSHNFVTARAECKRKGTVTCGMMYQFIIDKEPQPNQDVIVRVEPTGTLHHDLTVIDKRQLAGPKREAAKELLATMRPSVYRRSMYGKDTTDKEALKKGNLTEVQVLPVLIKAKQEGSTNLDLHPNVHEDLRLRRELFMEMDHLKTGKCPGYIQEWGNHPFFVALYMNRQFLLLKKYLAYNPNGLLTLDSTGKVCSNLPKTCGNNQAYYYAMVINLPGATESPVLPVLEYITTNQTAMNNSHILHFFFRTYGELHGKDQMGFGIQRIESDCSRTLISAVLQALEVGRTNRYLRDCWECLQKLKKIYLVYHICRNHASHFLSMKIQERFPVSSRDPIIKWSKWFLLSENLDEWCRRVLDVIYICGKKYHTREVDNRLTTLDTILNPEEPSPYGNDFLDSVPCNGPLYIVSPFSFFAVSQCRQLDIPLSKFNYKNAGLNEHVVELDADANEANFILNGYFCVEFVEYLIHNVFMYGGMFDHSLIRLNGCSTSQDTNAPCESWNRILKHDELGPSLGMKIGRFISFEEENLRGRLEQFEHGLRRMQRRIGQPTEDTEEPELPGSQNEALGTPESSSEVWKAKRLSQTRRTPAASELEGVHQIPFGIFTESPSGATNLEQYLNIDSMLQIIFSLWKLNPECKRFFETPPRTQVFMNLFQKLDAKIFNDAKILAIDNIMKIDASFLLENDLPLSELRFCKALSPYFTVIQQSKCGKKCINSQPKPFKYLNAVALKGCQAIPFILKRSRFESECKACGKKTVEIETKWGSEGMFPFFVLPVSQDPGVLLKETLIPSTIGVVGVSYSLYAYTFRVGKDFFAIFKEQSRKYMFNSKSSGTLEKVSEAPAEHMISSIWYIPKQN